MNYLHNNKTKIIIITKQTSKTNVTYKMLTTLKNNDLNQFSNK